MGFLAYIIKSWRGGVSEETDKGIAGSYKHGYAGDIRGRDDILTAKQAMLPITPSGMNDLVRFMVPANDGTTYCFGSSGSIWARSGDGTWTFAYNDENGEIKGASEWKVSTGLTYLFWATNTSIAVKPLVGNGVLPWTDVTADHKTTLDAADYHTMKQASGNLMIANGNYLATYSYDSTFDPAALNVIPGNLIKTMEERDDNVILGSYRKDKAEEGYLWSWVITAVNWIQKKRIPVMGVNALISAEILLLQGGSDGEIFTSDFVNALPVHGVPGGGQVNPDGVTIEDDIALFGFYGGTYPGIWSYGRKRKNQVYGLNYDYRLSPTVGGSTITEIGSILMTNGELLSSWKVTDGSTITYGVDQASSTTKATAVFEGLEFDNGTPHLKRMYQGVRVSMKPLPSGTSLSIKFKTDYETDWRYAVLGDNSTTFSVSGATDAEFLIGKQGIVYEVGAELNPSGDNSPQITAITTFVSKEANEH